MLSRQLQVLDLPCGRYHIALFVRDSCVYVRLRKQDLLMYDSELNEGPE